MTDKIKLKADKFVNDKKLKLNYIKAKDLKILLAEFCEEQIAELKAECDLTIEGRDVKIKELETRCNELFLQTCGQAEKIKELEAQIEKMKCCQNCSHLCGLCELGIKGCYVCSKWELRR